MTSPHPLDQLLKNYYCTSVSDKEDLHRRQKRRASSLDLPRKAAKSAIRTPPPPSSRMVAEAPHS
jgi:hypothetical protein